MREDAGWCHACHSKAHGGKCAEPFEEPAGERIARLEREKDEAEIAFNAAHAEMDGAEFRLGCADAYGAAVKAQLERANVKLEAVTQAAEKLDQALRHVLRRAMSLDAFSEAEARAALSSWDAMKEKP